MAIKTLSKDKMTTAQKILAKADIWTIRMWRANPVIAVNDLFNVQLLDYQAWIFQQTWVAENAVWLLTRNGGKTMLASIYVSLRQMLFPETEHWILGKSGKQARKLFSYIERLATNNIASFDNVSDIYINEVKKGSTVGNGFIKDPAGHRVTLLNEAKITTLNDNPDGNRGERGSIYVDEAGFVKEESIVAIEPYSTQDTSFKSSTNELFDSRTLPVNVPMQRIYFSSASDKTCYFYEKYKTFAKMMIAGDKRYFVADITIDVPLNPTIKGKPCGALLSKSVLDQAMATNPTKAMREYYNNWDTDGGDSQIIKSHTIERNSTFQLPEMLPQIAPNVKYGLFYDPAHRADNSVVLVGKFIYDDERGWYGQVVNMVNFKDLAQIKGNVQKLHHEQLDDIRELMVRYNGSPTEYENIHTVAIDGGSGGGGALYSHHLLLDFKDKKTGVMHRGIIDKEYHGDKIYEYPNAYPILKMIEPTKWKPIMTKRLIDLMDLGLIEFPQEYNNSGHIDVEVEVKNEKTGDISFNLVRKPLSKEEELALMNIDICKEEAKMIHEFKSANGRISYDLRVDMRKKMHDDRFYTLVMFASALHELRDEDSLSRHKVKKNKDKTVLSLFTRK